MKWLTLLVLVAGRCQGYDEIDARHQRLDGGGTPDASPDGGLDGDAGPECRPWSLGAAPRECVDTWRNAAILYPSCTDELPRAGYRARCGTSNVSIVEDLGKRVVCYYDPGTGNLALSVESAPGTETCLSYDPAVTSIPPGACAPLGAAACADGGAP